MAKFKSIIEVVSEEHPTWSDESKRQSKASHIPLVLEALVAYHSPEVIDAICKEHGIRGENMHTIKALHKEAIYRKIERTK